MVHGALGDAHRPDECGFRTPLKAFLVLIQNRVLLRKSEVAPVRDTGRDNKIQVNRKKLSDLGKKQTIGNNRKVSFTYEIVLKNNRNMDVVVEVLDQLPIPKEADITVDIDELSGAKRNEHDGTLTWRVPLKPGQTEKLELSFSIKFPKNKDVNIQKIRKYRTVKWM